MDRNINKKMRLGTRSCVECRRRKVRCVFDSNAKVCQACKAHETPCIKQGHQGGSTLNGQQKLESLERTVRRICEAVNLDAESSSLSDFEVTATEALKHLKALKVPNVPVDDDCPQSKTEYSQGDQYVDPSTADEFGDSEEISYANDAPLLSLFKDMTIVERMNFEAEDDVSSVFIEEQIRSRIEALKALIPSPDSLTLILEQTNKYWPLWPVWPFPPQNSVIGGSLQLSDQVASGKAFILGSVNSRRPVAAAKAVLWLAMCIQQLPVTFASEQNGLPATPDALLKAYLNGAEALLAAIDAEPRRDVDGIECLMMKAKLFIDQGKPRKAWSDNRRAINAALLMGLPRSSSRSKNSYSRIWTHIWQLDRQLSMILGLPYAIAESDPSIMADAVDQSIASRLLRRLSIVCGHIVDRNRNHQQLDYAVTTQIEHELDQYREAIPNEWWSDTPETSLEVAHDRFVIKFYCDFLEKMLHLPYMLKEFAGTVFQHSRLRALTASRGILETYLALQRNSLAARIYLVCDLMDFQVFSSAIVLVINLLSPQPCLWRPQQIVEDWALIGDLIQTFRHLSDATQCSVAAQGAQVLESLVMAHDGSYANTEPYEVTIPYFGKVKIQRVSPVQPQVEPSVLANASQAPAFDAPSTDFSNSIEFSTDFFGPLDASLVDGNFADFELGRDWTASLDSLPSYDWSESFYNMGAAGPNMNT